MTLSGFCISVLVALALALAGFKVFEQQREAASWVGHTQEVLARLADVRTRLVDLETGARGYVITGKEGYLEQHTSALAGLDAELRQLGSLVLGNPHQLARLRDFEEAAGRRFEAIRQIVDTRRSEGFAAAQKLFDAGLTQRQEERLRGILKELEQEEQGLSLARTQSDEFIAQGLWTGMAALIAILLAAVSALYLTIRRNDARRAELSRTLLDKEEVLSRFRAALDNAPGAIDLADAATMRIVDVNETACRMTGYSRAELLAMEATDLFVGLPEAKIRDAYDALVTGKCAVQTFEARHRRKDGSDYPVEVSRRHVKSGGSHIIVGVARDVSERNEIQNQLHDNQAKLEAALAETRQRNQEITTLAELGEVLQSCSTPEESYAPIAKFCALLFAKSAGALFLMHNSRTYLASVAAWGCALDSKDVFAPAECWALRRGRPHQQDWARGMRCPHLKTSGGGTCLCVPLTALGDTFGVLHLALDETQGDQNDLAVVTADRIALAIANLRLRETLSIQSIRDTLTGLYNRRYMEGSLQQEFARAKRSGRPLAVLMLDVDHFKRFNDTRGHDAGDAVLRNLGRLFGEQFRDSDTACRYGGEEFIVILPETGLASAQAKADTFRRAVSSLTADWKGIALDGITASIGLAVHPEHGDTPERLIEAADAALYRAKRAGRNRVVVGKTYAAQESAYPLRRAERTA